MHSATATDHFRALTLNGMLLFLGPWGSVQQSPRIKSRIKAMGQWLKAQQADFIFLQEITRPAFADHLQSLSGMPYRVDSAAMGTTFFSRYPLLESSVNLFYWQGSNRSECQQLALRYLIGQQRTVALLPDQRKICLIGTHTLPRYASLPGFAQKSDSLSPERWLHVLENLKALEDFTSVHPHPLIFLGDFNMNQQSSEYELFTELSGLKDSLRSFWKNEPRWQAAATFAEDNPHVREQKIPGEGILDHIFVSPADFEVIQAAIAQETGQFTDHYGVLMDFKISQNSTPQQFRMRAPSATLLQAIARHIGNVKMSRYRFLGPFSHLFQRQRSLRFIDSLKSLEESADRSSSRS